MKRMFAKIIEFDHLEYSDKIVNGILKYRILIHNNKQYQLKGGNGFDRRCSSKGGEYIFDNTNKENIGKIPNGYDCRCKAFEGYLEEIGYLPFIVTNKRHIRINKTKIDKLTNLITLIYNKLLWKKQK